MVTRLSSILLLFFLSSEPVAAWIGTSSPTRPPLGRKLQSSSSCVPQQRFRPTATVPRSTSSSTLRMSLMSDFLSYGLADYQLLAQSATSGLLCGTADVIAQTRERLFGERPQGDSSESMFHQESATTATTSSTKLQSRSLDLDGIDVGRCVRFACKGLVGGIIWSYWYGIVDDWSATMSMDALSHMSLWMGDATGAETSWTDSEGVQNAARIASAIVLEQFIACPLIYAFWDIPVPLLLNGTPPKEIPSQVSSKIGPLLFDNAKVWTIANVGIYSVPLEWRVLAMSLVDVFWQSVIASVTSKKEEEDSSLKVNGRKKKLPADESDDPVSLSLNPRIIEKKEVDELANQMRR